MRGHPRNLTDSLATPDQAAAQVELRECLREILLRRLTYRQRTIIQLYYGLYGSYQYDLAEIAKIMELDYGSVARLFALGLRKLGSRKGKLRPFLE
jgi:DNA-directed RNA polymerase sigma subunit (sigma70/sigma32)